MSLNKSEKQVVVTDVAAQAARSQTLALAEYRGLTVEHLNVLRRQARDKGVYLHVLKNSLARRAVVGTPFECASESMVGPLIYGFSQDAVAAAKVISDFAKGNDKLVVKAGAYAGKKLDADGVKALAAIPSKEVLLSQLLGLMKSPITRMAGVLAALAKKREEDTPVVVAAVVAAVAEEAAPAAEPVAELAAAPVDAAAAEPAPVADAAPEVASEAAIASAPAADPAA